MSGRRPRVRVRVARQESLARDVVVIEVDRRWARRWDVLARLRWWQDLRDPRLVEVLTASMDGPVLSVVVDQADVAPVAEMSGLGGDVVALIACETLAGLAVVHGSGHAHGVVNRSSVLVNGAGITKLAVPLFTAVAAQYLAPELGRKRANPSVAGDIYATGVLVRELLGATGASAEWNVIIAKATAQKPADRYASATDMADAIRALADREHGSAWVPVAAGALTVAAGALTIDAATSVTVVSSGVSAASSTIGAVNTGHAVVAWGVGAALVIATAIGGGVAYANRPTDDGSLTASATPSASIPPTTATPRRRNTTTVPPTTAASNDTTPATTTAPTLVATGTLHGIGDQSDYTVTFTIDPLAVHPGDTITITEAVSGRLIGTIGTVDGKALAPAQCQEIAEVDIGPGAGPISVTFAYAYGFGSDDGAVLRPADSGPNPSAPGNEVGGIDLRSGGVLSRNFTLHGRCLGELDATTSLFSADLEGGASISWTVPAETPPGIYSVVHRPPDRYGHPVTWAEGGTFPTVQILPSAEAPLTGTSPATSATAAADTTTVPDRPVPALVGSTITVEAH